MEKEEPIENYIGQYIGPDLIKGLTYIQEKTYLGNLKVKIIYESSEEELPLEVLKAIVTKEESDFTQLREKRVEPIVEKILLVLVESEAVVKDIQYAINTKLPLSIKDSISKANAEMWGKPEDKINLMDVEKVLKKK